VALVGKIDIRDHLEDLEVKGNIILKCILKIGLKHLGWINRDHDLALVNIIKISNFIKYGKILDKMRKSYFLKKDSDSRS
jgi:hypothetical protein